MRTVRLNLAGWFAILLIAVLSGCNSPSTQNLAEQPTQTAPGLSTPTNPASQPSPTPQPLQSLTICMADEPSSLFLYGDGSSAARTVREALYDGPFDLVQYEFLPVILEKKPRLADGDMIFQPSPVSPGDLIVTADGTLTNLAEGVKFLPSGCFSAECTQTYSGQDPILVDRLVVRFKLRQDVQWSDATPLTADDSLYSYEIAASLFPRIRAELLARTVLYQALDSYTIEWQGVPGYRPSSAATFFFDPLPRHAWGNLTTDDLLTSDLTNRQPLGYGPYTVENWIPGDRMNFSRNQLYFRAGEGLPRFDTLVFRFIPEAQTAVTMLQAGECDLLDETYHLEAQGDLLTTIKASDQLSLAIKEGTAWEHLDFGILPAAQDASQGTVSLAGREMRQALAQCIDRQRVVDVLFGGEVAVLEQYIPPDHPLVNSAVAKVSFDPPTAASALEGLGWLDADGDPGTPRISQGVEGVSDGTVLELTLLSANDQDSLQSAQVIQESLAQCGVRLNLEALPAADLLASGPQGPLFGRKFQLAKFAWQSSVEPPCILYTSAEIPGDYPDFPRGWGGANASGYSNPAYDFQCSLALSSQPEQPQYTEAHYQAQANLAQDLPFLPLYLHHQVLAARQNLCGLQPDASARSGLWNLESLDLNESCVELP